MKIYAFIIDANTKLNGGDHFYLVNKFEYKERAFIFIFLIK